MLLTPPVVLGKVLLPVVGCYFGHKLLVPKPEGLRRPLKDFAIKRDGILAFFDASIGTPSSRVDK